MSSYKRKTETKEKEFEEIKTENDKTYFLLNNGNITKESLNVTSAQRSDDSNDSEEIAQWNYDSDDNESVAQWNDDSDDTESLAQWNDSDDSEANEERGVKSDATKRPLIGDHETQESEGGEVNLHKHRDDCKKNPGHMQFIPVDTFTLNDLPKEYQDNDLYEFLKVIADLTVRINVEITSPDRPEFWPETTQPYPFYKTSKPENLRTGSGIVRHVTKFQDGVRQDGYIGPTVYKKCWCKKCEGSDSASSVWWEIDVNTATHVVFDDIEASHTILRLFFDRENCDKVVVDTVSVQYFNIEYDMCGLKCVTCDENLGKKLIEMWKDYEIIHGKVFNKYKSASVENTSQGVEFKLNFIVSHPHGCSKQVSVGEWKDRLEVGEDRAKFTYTTCTCPGSSGAHVICLGYNDDWLSDLVHSGTLDSKINYSGVGLF
ncbi:hypothetical protein BgiMline_021636 [Biomphalaria glabrata]|uniref:Uncharacterized protein LOC106054716 n=1 Tax=Biomphalaria glabrata TaxID=6526 RepID=A0A9W3B8E8_BIOGL|nr:uncharacterized protein LOC106054716 [Biomphalaria glabrata]XP_055895719.1 uncharacterized protein LOC106054716 [Biomphalaria glabrata]XP_055895720.1 uncharacterized protein LOC106054716 [Biomphalaria glabrata]KAI8734000.1 hypothetical protein BgiMline_028227 [Biomphalaria glabrata]